MTHKSKKSDDDKMFAYIGCGVNTGRINECYVLRDDTWLAANLNVTA
jgi:hypothetical protein